MNNKFNSTYSRLMDEAKQEKALIEEGIIDSFKNFATSIASKAKSLLSQGVAALVKSDLFKKLMPLKEKLNLREVVDQCIETDENGNKKLNFQQMKESITQKIEQLKADLDAELKAKKKTGDKDAVTTESCCILNEHVLDLKGGDSGEIWGSVLIYTPIIVIVLICIWLSLLFCCSKQLKYKDRIAASIAADHNGLQVYDVENNKFDGKRFTTVVSDDSGNLKEVEVEINTMSGKHGKYNSISILSEKSL